MVKLLVQLSPEVMSYKGHRNRVTEVLWQVSLINRGKFNTVEDAKNFIISIVTNNALEYKLELFGGGLNFGHTKTNNEFVAYGNVSYIPVL